MKVYYNKNRQPLLLLRGTNRAYYINYLKGTFIWFLKFLKFVYLFFISCTLMVGMAILKLLLDTHFKCLINN